jgi:ATP/ADP translocase
MFMKRPRHRVFDYPPRFYKPETDEQERRKRRLGFTRQRKYIRRKRSPFIWLILIIMVIYIILKLGGGL